MKRYLIVGNDIRMKNVFFYVKNICNQTTHLKSNAWSHEAERLLEEFDPTHIVFPVQSPDLLFSERLANDFKCRTIFSGHLKPEWRTVISNPAIRHVNYLQYEPFLRENARLTAISFFMYFFHAEKLDVRDRFFQIVGYGRLGKELAKLAHALGAHCVIIIGDETERKIAKEHGFETIELTTNFASANTPIINTIPARWITEDRIQSFQKCPSLYDLSSYPNCVCEQFEQQLQLIKLPNLPLHHLPKSAGELLGKTIIQIGDELDDQR